MKLSAKIAMTFNDRGEMIIGVKEQGAFFRLTPQEVTRLRHALNARATVSNYLGRQRMKRAMKAKGS